eukprot:scaffold297273_cov96-Cyclotella_meneghiniana.AAC.1
MPPTARPVWSSPTKNPATASPTIQPTANPVETLPPVTPAPISLAPVPVTTTTTSTTTTTTTTTTPAPLSSAPATSAPSTKFPTRGPTQSPTFTTCGNDKCESYESINTCPSDCSNVIFTAHNNGTSGASGIMFDLSASRNVVITSLDIYTDNIRNDAIEVFTRSGSYSGHEVNETGWVLIYSKNVIQKGRFNLTQLGDFEYGVSIQGGDTQAFYIYSNYTIMYDTGTEEGAVSNNDTSLTIYQGAVAVCYDFYCLLILTLFLGAGIASEKFPGTVPTQVVYSPRVFKGNIKYHVLAPKSCQLMTSE